jgi:hypothetical protein
MARWLIPTALLIALAACSQNGPGRAAIVERCVAGGEALEICQCLADQSSRKLDRDMFALVVLGAEGEETETDQLMREMAPDRQLKFIAAMREIIRSCGAEGYVAAG